MSTRRKHKRISERGFEVKLERLLERLVEPYGGWADTFEGAGVLTDNRGVVVHLGNGQEFQLTIVKSTSD